MLFPSCYVTISCMQFHHPQQVNFVFFYPNPLQIGCSRADWNDCFASANHKHFTVVSISLSILLPNHIPPCFPPVWLSKWFSKLRGFSVRISTCIDPFCSSENTKHNLNLLENGSQKYGAQFIIAKIQGNISGTICDNSITWFRNAV